MVGLPITGCRAAVTEENSSASCPRVILDGTRAHADEVPHHLCRRKDDMKTLRQAHQPFVRGPELHVRPDQGGGKQGHIHQPHP